MELNGSSESASSSNQMKAGLASWDEKVLLDPRLPQGLGLASWVEEGSRLGMLLDPRSPHAPGTRLGMLFDPRPPHAPGLASGTQLGMLLNPH